jgi:hypothetical protein
MSTWHPSGKNPARLKETANELLKHLYGEAGLVMSMETRNLLHGARTACLQFRPGYSEELLIDRFFYARRQLRLDIQITDMSAVFSALKEITAERVATPHASAEKA